MNSEDDYMGGWLDFGGYAREDERELLKDMARNWMTRSWQANVERRRAAAAAAETYDYITVDEDGTISAGTIARGTTYVWRPK